MNNIHKQNIRRVWGVTSFSLLFISILVSIQLDTVLVSLLTLLALVVIDTLVYGSGFYKLAHNPKEDLDEREFTNQTKAYRYSYMILSTILLLTIVSLTIFNDFTKGFVADRLPLFTDTIFWIVFYITLKLPIAIIGWYEKD